jgi:hypothetical protein
MMRSKRHFATLLLLILLPGTAAANPFEPDSMSDFIGQELGKAFNAFLDARANCEAFQRELDAARNALAGAADGNFQAEAQQLFRRLDERDYFFLLADVTSHPDSDDAKVNRMICPMDGVDPRLRPTYVNWVEALRAHMGAEGPDATVLTMPRTLAEAIEANQALTRTYVAQRNFQALLRAGVPMQRALSPHMYVQMLLDNHMRVVRGVDKDPKAPLGQQLHTEFLAQLSEAPVKKAAARVLALPKAGLFELSEAFVPPDPPGAGDGPTWNPLTAFYVLLQEDPKAYVALHKAFEGLEDGPSAIARGFAYYDDLVARFGEKAVETAATRVQAAPKLKGAVLAASRSGLSVEPATVWVERVLADPTIVLPSREQEVGIAAADTASIRASKDNLQRIYGRVNDVLWRDGTRASDGSDYDYFYVYFAGSEDFATLVYRHAYDGAHGPDAQAMIGKLFRITAPIFQRTANQTNPIAPNWHSMGRASDEFSIISEAEWPQHLPIPGMKPARTKDQILADRTDEVDGGRSSSSRDRGRGRASDRPTTVAGACSPDPNVNMNLNFPRTGQDSLDLYLAQTVEWAMKVGAYEGLRDACGDKRHAHIREDFVRRAVGHLDPGYAPILSNKVEMMYGTICRHRNGCIQDPFTEREVNGIINILADKTLLQKHFRDAFPDDVTLLPRPAEPYSVFTDEQERLNAEARKRGAERRAAEARGEPPPIPGTPPLEPVAVTERKPVPEPEPEPPAVVEATSCGLEQIAGTYQSRYGEMTCRAKDEHLHCCYAWSGERCRKWLELALHAEAPLLRGTWEYANGTTGNAEFGVGDQCAMESGRWGYEKPTKGWAVSGRTGAGE